MFSRQKFRLILVLLILAAGIWAIVDSVGLVPESGARQEAVQLALAPGRSGGGGSELSAERPQITLGAEVSPAEVNLQDVPTGPSEVDRLYEAYQNGELDLEINEGPVSDAAFQAMIKESLGQPVDANVQNYVPSEDLGSLNIGASFKSIDYTQSQQGVPPDPDIMVGKDHVVVGVNTSFQVFDKNGNSLYGPVLYESFWGSNCGSGSSVVMFDPYSGYDEEAGRYVLGITAYDPSINGGDNGWACIAVSKTDSATGQWWLYSFDGNPGGGSDYFFDYPHMGIGQDAIYLAANMFGFSFVRNHVFAFEKDAMYAGQAANSVKINVGSSNFTIQPAKIHGYTTGGWPTNPNEPHYFIDAQYGNNQNKLTVWRFTDPWGSPSLSQAGAVTVNSYSLPVNQPQAGSSGQMQGNDNRLLDVQYWGGKLWATHAVGCNPGGGTVNCVRWYEIDISSGSPSLVQQGTFSSSGDYRSFPDLAVNACGDMVVGYSLMNSSIFPSVYAAGREAGDAPGQLKSETLVHAGEAFYTAYDSSPRRWGDYTGMAIDPDGITMWYVGEYSRQQATARWSTWVAAFNWSACSVGPTPTPGPTATATNTPLPTETPGPTVCTVYDSTDVPKSISSSGSPSVNSTLNVSSGGAVVDVNVLNLNGTHTYINDLDFNLQSPAGSWVQIMDRSCSSQNNFNLSLDDEAAPGSWPCPPTDGGTYQPSSALSAFDGQDQAGTWTLRVDDNANLDGGSLNGWSLEICVEDSSPEPTATNTPVPPTATNTPVPPTATNTPAGPTATPNSGNLFCISPGLSIPDPGSTSSSIVLLNDNRTLTDLDVSLNIDHSYVGDLSAVVVHEETGTSVTLLDRPGHPARSAGCPGDDIEAVLSDEAGSPAEDECSRNVPVIAGNLQPNGALAAFDGEAMGGTWTLQLTDVASQDAGVLNQWCLMATFADGPTPTNTPVGPTPTATNTPVPPTATATPEPGSEEIYVSSSSGGTVDGVAYGSQDILVHNVAADSWAMYFDGSDVGINTDLNAFAFLADDSILMSFDAGLNVTGVGAVDEYDIVRFVPSSVGANTGGTFELYFDGSDVGLSSASQNIDALSVTTGGDLIISISNRASLPGSLRANDEDLLLFSPTSLGSSTSGSWTIYFDGSDVGLTNSSEDVWGAWQDTNGDIYLTAGGSFAVSGASGDGADIFVCTPSSTGSSTSCSFSLYFDGSAHGLTGQLVDGIAVMK